MDSRDGRSLRQRTAPRRARGFAGLLPGDPRRALIEEVDQWQADCIFVGARGLSQLDRFLLGSVSAAVASRAHCSVEIIRTKASAGLA